MGICRLPCPRLGSRQLEVCHIFPLILTGVVLDRMIQLSYHHQYSKFYSFFS